MKKRLLWLLIGSMVGQGVFAGEMPSWLEGWSFGGDFRLRYEGTVFDNDAIKDRNRGRYRLRIGAKKQILENLKFGLRLASGDGSATSTNETFDDSFNGKDLNIDQAYLVYDINDWTLGGGKVKNPFHSTNITWDSDVNPEGLYQQYNTPSFYAVFGQMAVEEERASSDTNLLAAQIGTRKDKVYDVSLAYYSYQNLDNGSTTLDFEFFELVADYQLGPGLFQATYIKNTSNGIDDEDTAYGVFYSFEKNKYSFEAKYAHVEANSVLGIFADSDFGFVDVKGFSLGGSYQISKSVSTGITVFSVDSILADDAGFNRYQVDLSLKL